MYKVHWRIPRLKSLKSVPVSHNLKQGLTFGNGLAQRYVDDTNICMVLEGCNSTWTDSTGYRIDI